MPLISLVVFGLPDGKYTLIDGENTCASLPLYQLHHCRFNCFILFKYRRHHVCGVADSADAPIISMYRRQRGCSQYLHVSETARMFTVSPCIGDSADVPSISMYWRQRGCSQYLHVSETAQMLPVSICIGDSADVPSISLYWRQRG